MEKDKCGKLDEAQRASRAIRREIWDTCKTALPLMAIGGLAGLLFHAAGRYINTTERTAIVRHDIIFDRYPAVKHWWDIFLCNDLQSAAVIHPSWLGPFLEHANHVGEVALEIDRLVKRAEETMPKDYINAKNAGSDFMNGIMSDVHRTFALFTRDLVGNDTMANRAMKRSSNRGNTKVVDLVSQKMAMMSDLIYKSQECIKAVHASRITFAAMFEELIGMATLYNDYWQSAGSLIMADPSLMSKREAAQVIMMKMDLIAFLGEHGALPSRITMPSSNDNAASSSSSSFSLPAGISSTPNITTPFISEPIARDMLRWWLAMHTTFLAPMYHACHLLGLTSIFNNVKSDNRSSPVVPSTGRNVYTHVAHASRNIHVAGLDQGHLFQPTSTMVPPNTNVPPEEAERMKREGYQDGIPVYDFKRPSNQSSLVECGVFLVRRIKTEGIASVIDAPWAGFLPSSKDPCFLPTRTVKLRHVRHVAETFIKQTDELIGHMYSQQARLMHLYMKLVQYTNPDIEMRTTTVTPPKPLHSNQQYATARTTNNSDDRHIHQAMMDERDVDLVRNWMTSDVKRPMTRAEEDALMAMEALSVYQYWQNMGSEAMNADVNQRMNRYGGSFDAFH